MWWYNSPHILQSLDNEGHSGTRGVLDLNKGLQSALRLPISELGTLDLNFFDENCIPSGMLDDVYNDWSSCLSWLQFLSRYPSRISKSSFSFFKKYKRMKLHFSIIVRFVRAA